MNKTDWIMIFSQSPVNGGVYNEIPVNLPYRWPNDTWFQRKLQKKREMEKKVPEKCPECDIEYN